MKPEKQVLMTAMTTSISEVMETMFFLPIDFPDINPEEKQWDRETGAVMATKLDFTGPFSGYGLFYIPREAAESISADFLGMNEETVSVDQVRETVMEIINMIVGSTLSCYDQKAVFNLTIPTLVGPDDQGEERVDSENKISIIIDTLEHHLAFMMVIDP